MHFKTLVNVVLLFFLTTFVTAAEHTKDSLQTIRKNMKEKKAVLIDVREQGEWDAGHLNDAALVPLSRLRAGPLDEATKKKLPKKKIIYCHCKSGGRVLLATDVLKKQGYDIRPLKLGFQDLLKAGFKKAEVKKDKAPVP